jgi:uncharacterized protein
LVIYLHGFASSARSGKASFFAQRCREAGIEFEAPDLNVPDFSTLTVTRMLDQTRALLDRASGPATLMGSSLGGYVAVLAAARWPEKSCTCWTTTISLARRSSSCGRGPTSI